MDQIEPSVYARQKSNVQLLAMQSISIIKSYSKSYDLIVDLGCGDGDVTKNFLAKHIPHKRIVAIDCLPEMLDYARTNNPDSSIDYQLQDMGRKWPDMSPRVRQLDCKVDLIFANLSFGYIPDKRQLMDTIGHLLSTGGMIHANIELKEDINKRLASYGWPMKKQWYESPEKQADNWRQCLQSMDNQLLIKQFETIDVCWTTDRQKMIDFMPILISKFRKFFNDPKDFDSELNDHLWDTAFDAMVNPLAIGGPNPRAWQQFLADPNVKEVKRYHQLLRITAIKQ
ncbi:trans-aconitate 2-methyltransferase-like [Oppia nitens]|uniref:trans-aconitate 2-methyltransferase-like n=1 Tax=Oppia nitens TaxID=1686743 RepID=UPI0023DA4CE4|nr:trans-aconitate 2-methyltransferase-like [Oppia nitens]